MSNNSKPVGRFLVFEGPDGSGKSSQLTKAADFIYERTGVRPLVLRSPGGSELAEIIRDNILSREGLPNEVRLYGMLLSMLSTTLGLVQPALESGQWVLMDRYLLSTIIYQGLLAGVPVYRIKEAVDSVFRSVTVKPNAYLVFHVLPDTSIQRINRRNEARTVFEKEDIIRKMNPAYLFSQSFVEEPVFYIDGEGSIDEVWSRTRARVSMFL